MMCSDVFFFLFFFFFFSSRRRHTRCIGDWSSDVCSSDLGSGASPVVYNGLVWINNDQDGPSSLIALKVDSGAVSYKIDRLTDKVSYGTPCLWQEAGRLKQLIFASSSHGLTSVNPLNGAINWDYTNLFEARVVSSPISGDGLIFCSSGEGGVGG